MLAAAGCAYCYSSGLNCLDICGENHFLYAFAEVPVSYDLVAVFLVLDDDGREARRGKNIFQFLHGNRSRNSAAVSIFVFHDFFGKFAFLQHVGNRESPARSQDSVCFIENGLLIRRKINHAIRNNYVH